MEPAAACERWRKITGAAYASVGYAESHGDVLVDGGSIELTGIGAPGSLDEGQGASMIVGRAGNGTLTVQGGGKVLIDPGTPISDPDKSSGIGIGGAYLQWWRWHSDSHGYRFRNPYQG